MNHLRPSMLLICVLLIAGGVSSFDEHAKKVFPAEYFHAYPNDRAGFNCIVNPMAMRYVVLAASLVAKRDTKAELGTLLRGIKPSDLLGKIHELKHGNDYNVRLYVNNKTDVSDCVKEKTHEFLRYINYEANNALKPIEEFLLDRSNVKFTKLKKLNSKDGYVNLVHLEHLDLKLKHPFERIVEVGKLTMMEQTNEFLYGNLTELAAEVIQIPFEGDARMLVIHPYDQTIGENFKALKEKLLHTDLLKLSSSLKKRRLNLFFPALKDIYTIRPATRALNKLGIKHAFGKDADFSRLHPCADDSFIENVYQNTRITTELNWMTFSSATDLRIVQNHSPMTISAEEDDEEDADANGNELLADVSMEKEVLKFQLGRFLFILIKGDSVVFMGTLVKDHNNPDP